MSVPDWWSLTLLALASFRTWRLLSEDEILDRPRRWLLRLGSEWQKEGDPVPAGYRLGWGAFLSCSWCMGLWASLAWWLAWQIDNKWTLIAATPFAISALVGFQRNKLDPPEDDKS